jgi:cytochrome c553
MAVCSRILLAGLAAACLLASPLVAGAQATQDVSERVLHVCASCHGEGGRSTQPGNPRLAGQMAQYTARQLTDFRDQMREEIDPQAYMWGISALLDDDVINKLATYYAEQVPAAGKPGRAKEIAAGRAIYDNGIESRKIRSCGSCHGDRAEGTAAFPRLAGQHADYTYKQLKVFGTKLRPHGPLMKKESTGLTSAEMRAVAAYVQSL